MNVGQVGGGSGDNVVAAEAWARVDARAWTAPEQQRLERAIRGLRPVLEGATIEVAGGITRPPMIPSDESAELAAQRAIEIAAGLGQPLSENASGGGSDGNFAAAVGDARDRRPRPDRGRRPRRRRARVAALDRAASELLAALLDAAL